MKNYITINTPNVNHHTYFILLIPLRSTHPHLPSRRVLVYHRKPRLFGARIGHGL